MKLTRLAALKQAAVIGVIGMLVVSTVGLVAHPASPQQSPQPQQDDNASQVNTTTEVDNGSTDRSADDILQAAQESYQDIEDFNATLVSSSTISNGSGVVQTSNTTGKLSVKQPGKVRLEILEPEAQAGSVVVSNGSTTVFYDAANNTVSSFNLSSFGGMAAANQTGYLSGIEQSLSQANVSYEGTATVAGQDTYVLSVTPNASVGNLTSNQTYYLSQESYIPVKTVTESSFSFGNETTTTTSTTILRDLQVNVGLSDSVFDFEAPEDANRTGGFTSNVSTYDSVEAAQENTDITVCEPSEIPEGYSFANATVTTLNDNTSVTLRYTNDSVESLNSSLSVGISTAQPTQQANESSLGENVSVNGQSGTYIGANGQGILTFTSNDLQYTITGPLAQDDLISIAESLDCAAVEGEDGADGGGTNATDTDGDTAEKDEDAAYYQVDFVVGEPIENLRGPNGTYTNDRLIRFAHGSTDDPIMRRSDGEFITDTELAERIESQEIDVANGTATTTFTVTEGESVTLTLASYEKIGPGWSPETEAQQDFVDSQTRTFESGTHTLRVDLPSAGTAEDTRPADDEPNGAADGTDGAGHGDNATTLTILSYNDIQTAAARDQNLPRLVELISDRRQAHDNPTVVVGGGDEIAPHALGPLSQWRAPVDVLNLVGPDAEGVGNHDLDYGLSGFANASAASEFPWLVANLRNATTGDPITGAESYEIVEKDGVRVGFVGLVDPSIKNKTNLAFGENATRLTDFREVGPETAEMLKEERNVDVVVALAHIGVPESKELARADNGAIDAIVTGDDEIYYPPQETSGTVITEAGATAAYLGEVNLTVEGGEVTGANGRIINVTNATSKNETASEIITEYRAEASLDQTVAVSEVALDARRPSPTAVRETAYGHLITDAMRNETGADVAIVQEGGIRSNQVYGPGNITGSDVFSTLPFGNTLVTLEVTGEELKATLASQIRSDRPEEGVAQQVSGISFEWTDDPDAEETIQNVTVGGEPLDENATYSLTVSNFVAEGGDGYPLADQPRINETDKLLATTVIEYMEALGTVSPSAEGRTEEIGAGNGSGENATAVKMPDGIRAIVA